MAKTIDIGHLEPNDGLGEQARRKLNTNFDKIALHMEPTYMATQLDKEIQRITIDTIDKYSSMVVGEILREDLNNLIQAKVLDMRRNGLI